MNGLKRLLIAVLLLLMPGIVPQGRAQLIPALGRERAGTASATFLKIGVGARAAAMGDAFVSLASDPTALYWNPAGIAQLQGTAVHFSHLEYVAEIGHEFFGMAHKLSDADAIGVSIIALHTDEMNVTTEVQPFGTGERFAFSDLAVGLSYARQLTDRFSAGVTAKYVREDLATVHLSGFLSMWAPFTIPAGSVHALPSASRTSAPNCAPKAVCATFSDARCPTRNSRPFRRR